MSLLEKKYNIKGWYGDIYSLTAKQLCERVLKDSQSDYNWIAPARELTRICRSPGFPAEYALTIKITILNCFANIEHRANCGGDRYRTDPADEKAVEYCYNSLYSISSEEAISVRKYYLTEMISTASYVHVMFDSLYHPGPTFRKLREDWNKSKFEEYISQENIDFKQLIETLHNDFAETVKTAESNGDFEEDEKKDAEEQAQFFRKIFDLLD